MSKVDFFQGATLIGTASAAPYSFSIATLAPGTYSFTAVAADDRGGSTTSAPVSVIVNAPPSVTLTSPTANASFKAPASIALAATAGDSDGTVSSVAFYNGDTLITTLTTAPYAFTWTGVPQGTYTLTARVTDNTGDTVTSDPVNVTVTAAVAQLYFIEVDHLDTPRLVANAAGATVWKWDQGEPFGDNVADENPSGFGSFDLPLRLPGQTYDKETGLHYNYYRDFDPSLGRYGASDPIGLKGGLNTYAYVGGDPVRRVDIDGLLIQLPGTPASGSSPVPGSAMAEPMPGRSAPTNVCFVDYCTLEHIFRVGDQVVQCIYDCAYTGMKTTGPNLPNGCKPILD